MPDGRTIILGRIREALKLSAPHPADHAARPGGGEAHGHRALGVARDWLPPVGPTFDEQVALFGSNAEALKARFEPVDSLEEAAGILSALAVEEGWKRMASHRDALTQGLIEKLSVPGLEILPVDGGYEKSALESCDAGLTRCEALVAQTGSVLVASTTCGGRALSVLPPHHVVIARRDQLLPDLQAAFAQARQKLGDNAPSMLSLITGPSRTGDIERILVLGAHGPKKLTILFV